jgi:hypothetical protein
MALTLTSIAVLVAFAPGDLGSSPILFMVPGVLYVCSIGALIFLGNALGQFGPKYAIPPLAFPPLGYLVGVPSLLLPFIGFLVSYLWLRGQVLRITKADESNV